MGYTKQRYLEEADPEEWLALIEDMVESGEHEYAEDTLLDIGATIEETGRVTNGQETAIKNILYGKGNW